MKTVKVFLREKKISKGRKSLYLDFYPSIKNRETGKNTRREFLGLYIYEKPKGAAQIQNNKQIRALGESIRSKRFLEIQQNIYGLESGVNEHLSFLDFFKDLVGKKYTSIGNYGNWKGAYKHLSNYFSDGITMGELSKESLNDYRDYLMSLDLAQNTKSSYFGKLKAALKIAFEKNYIRENIGAKIKSIKLEEVEIEFVTKEELKMLSDTECENSIIKKAFIFSALTGLRFSDCKKLTWSEIQKGADGSDIIRFKQKKTRGLQTLPLSQTVIKHIGERQKKNDPVFKGLNYSAWNNEKLKRWVLKAGIDKRINFHCARHSFATIQLTLGTDIYTLSKLLGHKHIQTTQVYGKVVNLLKVEAMNRINEIEL